MCRTTQLEKTVYAGNVTHKLLMNLHWGAKRRASKKGVPFTPFFPILRDKVIASDGNCPCCGVLFVQGKIETAPTSLTVHRVVSELGYVPGNIEILCNQCNEDIGEVPHLETLDRKRRALEWQVNRMRVWQAQ